MEQETRKWRKRWKTAQQILLSASRTRLSRISDGSCLFDFQTLLCPTQQLHGILKTNSSLSRYLGKTVTCKVFRIEETSRTQLSVVSNTHHGPLTSVSVNHRFFNKQWLTPTHCRCSPTYIIYIESGFNVFTKRTKGHGMHQEASKSELSVLLYLAWKILRCCWYRCTY